MRRLLHLLFIHAEETARERRSFRELVDSELRAMVRRRLAESSPFPPATDVGSGLKELLEASRARDVKRIIRGLSITQKELAALIFNAHRFGYNHERFGFEKVPQHLRMTEEERTAFFFKRKEQPNLVERATRKIDRVFAERRVYSAHVFANEQVWHVFSFTYDDAQLGRRGHWSAGAHLHYTSSVLEPRKTLAEVVAELRAPESEIHGEHVRFLFDEDRGARRS